MARTKNYGFCRNEAISLRLSWKDKAHLDYLCEFYKLNRSEVVRLLINTLYLDTNGLVVHGMDGGEVIADQ